MTLTNCAARDLSAANGVQANSGKTITAISEWAFYCDLNPVKVRAKEQLPVELGTESLFQIARAIHSLRTIASPVM